MALIKCRECGKEISSQAPSCPHCGAPAPKPPKGVGAGDIVKWAIAAFFGYIIFSCTTALEKADRAESSVPSSAAAAPEAAASPAAPLLELLSWRCEKEYNYAHVKGEVKNISGQTLKNILAVGTLRTKGGELVDSDDTLLDLKTLLPGQKSAFDVMIHDNPLGVNCNVSFKTFRGESIDYKRK